jgi:hypothetical protein
MFAALRERLEGNTLEHVLRDVMSIAPLEQRAGQSEDSYFSEVRRLSNSLHNVTVSQILPLIALCRLDLEQLPGICASLQSCDPTLLSANINTIEQCHLSN